MPSPAIRCQLYNSSIFHQLECGSVVLVQKQQSNGWPLLVWSLYCYRVNYMFLSMQRACQSTRYHYPRLPPQTNRFQPLLPSRPLLLQPRHSLAQKQRQFPRLIINHQRNRRPQQNQHPFSPHTKTRFKSTARKTNLLCLCTQVSERTECLLALYRWPTNPSPVLPAIRKKDRNRPLQM